MMVAILIVLVSSLPYLHDQAPRGGGEFYGFSSLRVFLYLVFTNLFAHLGWLIAFFIAKGKPYRFALLVPVTLSLYVLIVNILNLKATSFHDLTTRYIIIMVIILGLVLNYFKNRING